MKFQSILASAVCALALCSNGVAQQTGSATPATGQAVPNQNGTPQAAPGPAPLPTSPAPQPGAVTPGVAVQGQASAGVQTLPAQSYRLPDRYDPQTMFSVALANTWVSACTPALRHPGEPPNLHKRLIYTFGSGGSFGGPATFQVVKYFDAFCTQPLRDVVRLDGSWEQGFHNQIVEGAAYVTMHFSSCWGINVVTNPANGSCLEETHLVWLKEGPQGAQMYFGREEESGAIKIFEDSPYFAGWDPTSIFVPSGFQYNNNLR